MGVASSCSSAPGKSYLSIEIIACPRLSVRRDETKEHAGFKKREINGTIGGTIVFDGLFLVLTN